MPVAIDLSRALDKAWEDKNVAEVLAAPVSAIAGVSENDAALLKQAFGIDTVRELGTNKYFTLAQHLVALSDHAG